MEYWEKKPMNFKLRLKLIAKRVAVHFDSLKLEANAQALKLKSS